jgi:hypothetical protein
MTPPTQSVPCQPAPRSQAHGAKNGWNPAAPIHAADHQAALHKSRIAARLIDIQLHGPLARGIRARIVAPAALVSLPHAVPQPTAAVRWEKIHGWNCDHGPIRGGVA